MRVRERPQFSEASVLGEFDGDIGIGQ